MARPAPRAAPGASGCGHDAGGCDLGAGGRDRGTDGRGPSVGGRDLDAGGRGSDADATVSHGQTGPHLALLLTRVGVARACPGAGGRGHDAAGRSPDADAQLQEWVNSTSRWRWSMELWPWHSPTTAAVT
jgi:hypothetical protein